MAIKVDSRSRTQAIALPPDPPDPAFATAIADFEKERKAGAELIAGLTGRVRKLEEALSKERLEKNGDRKKHADQIFAKSQQTERLAQQFEQAQQEVQRLTQQLDQIKKQAALQAQDAQLLNAARQEVRVLEQQVALLTQQLQVAMARGDALQLQINQLQRIIVDNQREQMRLLKKIQSQKQEPSQVENFFTTLFKVVTLDTSFHLSIKQGGPK